MLGGISASFATAGGRGAATGQRHRFPPPGCGRSRRYRSTRWSRRAGSPGRGFVARQPRPAGRRAHRRLEPPSSPPTGPAGLRRRELRRSLITCLSGQVATGDHPAARVVTVRVVRLARLMFAAWGASFASAGTRTAKRGHLGRRGRASGAAPRSARSPSRNSRPQLGSSGQTRVSTAADLERNTDVGRAPGVRDELAEVVARDLPRPRQGRTRERWAALQRLGEEHDLSLAKLAESHLDAVEILAEAGLSPAGSGLYGCGPRRRADPADAIPGRPPVRLRGRQHFASGARLLDRALVTAVSEGAAGTLLVDIPLDDGGITVVPGSWPAVGMAATDSVELEVDIAVPAEAVVGEANWYVRRPGFWVGGSVLRLWLGGAHRVLAPLAERAAAQDASELVLAHYGAAFTRVVGCEALPGPRGLDRRQRAGGQPSCSRAHDPLHDRTRRHRDHRPGRLRPRCGSAVLGPCPRTSGGRPHGVHPADARWARHVAASAGPALGGLSTVTADDARVPRARGLCERHRGRTSSRRRDTRARRHTAAAARCRTAHHARAGHRRGGLAPGGRPGSHESASAC